MPSAHSPFHSSVQQLLVAPSDTDYIDGLVTLIKEATLNAREYELQETLARFSSDRERDIETLCNGNHSDFVSSVDQLLTVRSSTVDLTAEILSLNEAIQKSTRKVVEQKKRLVDSRDVREHIDEATKALKMCLEVLGLANRVGELLRTQKYYAALRTLEELKSFTSAGIFRGIGSEEGGEAFEMVNTVQRSVPGMQAGVKDAVMLDLNRWLWTVRENERNLGQVAFDQTELRRRRQKERIDKSPYLSKCTFDNVATRTKRIFLQDLGAWSDKMEGRAWMGSRDLRLEECVRAERKRVEDGGSFKLNSAIELVLDEREEFDVVDNDDVRTDFTPLFECIHIHEALGERDEFRMTYTSVRRQQKELLMPASLQLVFTDDDISGLNQLLESICGFAILERETMRKTVNFRSETDVDELWESMCKKAIAIISPALDKITTADTLLKIKNVLALFIQTMGSWGYAVDPWDTFLLDVFQRYSALLKADFASDFKEIVTNDDYMPMPINGPEEYDNVINVSWFKPDCAREDLEFPLVLPFSQMYPLCCIDIRNFLNKYYFFSDEYFQSQEAIDDELKTALDELLCVQVSKSLVERLQSKYLGQIVQILINLEQFEYACQELELLLAEARQSKQGGSISLRATDEFRSRKKDAEKRIFELVNSKIDDLVDTAEYDWMSPGPPDAKPSEYLREISLFLTDIMNSTLLGLPRDIKGLIYFDALSHLADSVTALPLADDVPRINRNGVAALDRDVTYLQTFVEGLNEPTLLSLFEELRQTVGLLKSDNQEEFYNIDTRMKKYANVNALRGPVLLEKLIAGTEAVQTPVVQEKESRTDRLINRFRDR